jgi:hypothetical protein
MSKLSWVEMMQAHPACHLVVGTVDAKMVLRPVRLIERLLERLKPRGRYAVTILREPAGLAVHCAFLEKTDADRLASAIQADGQADGTSRYPGWASQRWFRLNAAMAAAIAAALDDRSEPSNAD